MPAAIHRHSLLLSWALRLCIAYGILVLAAWLGGAWYGEALLPLYKTIMQWICADYRVLGFDLVKAGAEPRFVLAVVSHRYQFVSGLLVPPGFYVQSSTLLGHALQHPVVMFTLLGAWPDLSGLRRLGLFAIAVPFLLVVECIDIPFVIAGNVHASLLESVAPQAVGGSWLVWWIDFMGGGGRLAISLAAAFAALAVYRSIEPARRDFSRAMPVLLMMLCALAMAIEPTPAFAAKAAQSTPADAATAKAPPEVIEALSAGHAVDIIVLFEEQTVRQWAQSEVLRRRLRHEDAQIVAQKALRYRDIKQKVLASMLAGDIQVLTEYDHLPMSFVRVRRPEALARLLTHPLVAAVFRDTVKYPILDSQSANLVGQPVAAALGFTGSGSAVLVIDTGVNYTLTDFGYCTAPGTPATCRVVYYRNIADGSASLDASGHGTNVSGIVIGVAADTRIAALNVFGASSTTSDSLVIQAINWGIANQATYNIGALNMSLGDGSRNTAPCGNKRLNPYYSPVQNAKSAGILSIAASGNDTYTDAISNPACTPNVVSVGAVYSANWGGLNWSVCTDYTTVADQVTCFSDSASFLTMLAPGALITAGGLQYGGTSQASPFVAGAVAVLRAAYPADTLDQTLSRLTSSGVPVTDLRNSITKPRLSLAQSVRPANDLFINRVGLSGSSGGTGGSNTNASKESGEPNHAGNPGGASVWWKWTAPGTGQASFNTGASSFNPLLAIYTGTGVSSLTSVAATASGNSGVLFQATQGTEYQIAVDGYNGATGNITLNWSLNTAASADVSVTLTAAPSSIAAGGQVTWTAVARNNGPQSATNVVVSDTLPAALAFVSASAGCTQSGATVNCNLGTLANTATASAAIVASANSQGTVTNQMSVNSDLPDSVPGNNTASVAITVMAAPPGANDNDVPTLPEWAAMILAASLAVVMFRRQTL